MSTALQTKALEALYVVHDLALDRGVPLGLEYDMALWALEAHPDLGALALRGLEFPAFVGGTPDSDAYSWGSGLGSKSCWDATPISFSWSRGRRMTFYRPSTVQRTQKGGYSPMSPFGRKFYLYGIRFGSSLRSVSDRVRLTYSCHKAKSHTVD